MRLRLLHHAVLPVTGPRAAAAAALLLLGGAFVAGDFLFFRRAFDRLAALAPLAPQVVGPLVERLLGLLLVTALSTLAFSSLVTSLASQFLSRDLPLLLSTPLPTGKVFGAKQVEASLQASYMVWLALLPALCGYGAAAGAGAYYYALLGPLLLASSAAATCAGSLVVLALVRRFPARRLHQALSIAGALLLAALVAGLRLARPERLLDPEAAGDLAAAGELALAGGGPPAAGWLARGLVAAGRGDARPLLGVVAALALAGAVAGGLLAAAQRRWYREAWDRSLQGRSGPGAARRLPSPRLPSSLRAPAALAAKDLRIFARDPSRWSQLLLIGALVGLHLFNVAHLPASPAARGLVAFLNLALTGFVLAAIGLRFAYTAASQEGAAMALLRASPIGMGRYLGWKFATLAPPLAGMGACLVWSSNRLLGVDAFVMAHSVYAVLALAVGLVGLGIGLGALWPRFAAIHPQEAATSPGGLLYMILSLGYLAAALALLIRPLGRHVLIGVLPDARFLPAGGAIWLAGVAALSALVAGLPLALGARALSRRDL